MTLHGVDRARLPQDLTEPAPRPHTLPHAESRFTAAGSHTVALHFPDVR